MAELKTRKTGASVDEFLATVDDERRRADAEAVCELMTEATGTAPAMWGTGIVGFGSYHYKYPSGQEADWPAVGFSPRKAALTIYLAEGLEPHTGLLARLGPHKTGKGCLYLKRLSDVDTSVLRELVREGFRQLDGKSV